MKAVSAASRSVEIQGPVGVLEARLEGETESPRFVAIVCHPHSLYGGSMDNKVVTTIARACREAGAAVVRFNFRGVGASDGNYDGGRGETQDLLAVHDWLRGRYPGRSLWLAGFSFGSFVAASGAARLAEAGDPVHQLLLVAPPVHHYDFAALDVPGCPVTVIQGDEDDVVPVEEVRDWVGESPWRPEFIEFPGAGHFFHGRLIELRDVVAGRLP